MATSDEALYSKILEKSEEAFRTLYERHSRPLFGFIYRFTGCREVAEEILHDTLLELLSGKFKIEPNANLKSWLYTIAKNKGLNYLKKKKREFSNDEVIETAASDFNLETKTINSDLIKNLNLAEKILPDELKHTWHLRKRGLDNLQIAEELSIPVGTVKSRFHRLVEFLRKELIKNEK